MPEKFEARYPGKCQPMDGDCIIDGMIKAGDKIIRVSQNRYAHHTCQMAAYGRMNDETETD